MRLQVTSAVMSPYKGLMPKMTGAAPSVARLSTGPQQQRLDDAPGLDVPRNLNGLQKGFVNRLA